MTASSQQPTPGHRLVDSNELTGQALAWAVCALYGVPAAIFEGVVHVEAEPGKWLPFDPEAMLRSLVAGHVPTVLIPDEIAAAALSGGVHVEPA